MCLVSSCSCLCSIHWSLENEDVVGAAPTGDVPTTSELSTILLSTKVRLILEVLWYYDIRIERHVDQIIWEAFPYCEYFGHGNCVSGRISAQRGNYEYHQYIPWIMHMLSPGTILGMGSVNERRSHNVMSSLGGWTCTQNNRCLALFFDQQTVEQAIVTLVIWDPIALIMTSL